MRGELPVKEFFFAVLQLIKHSFKVKSKNKCSTVQRSPGLSLSAKKRYLRSGFIPSLLLSSFLLSSILFSIRHPLLLFCKQQYIG